MKVLKKTKDIIMGNNYLKFITIGGAVAAGLKIFTSSPLLDFIGHAGQFTGGYALNKAIHEKPVDTQTQAELSEQIQDSAFLLLGGFAVSIVCGILPGSPLLQQVSSTIITAGFIGGVDAGVEKIKRKKRFG